MYLQQYKVKLKRPASSGKKKGKEIRYYEFDGMYIVLTQENQGPCHGRLVAYSRCYKMACNLLQES